MDNVYCYREGGRNICIPIIKGGNEMSLDVYLSIKTQKSEVSVYSANITHNLGAMATYAGLYDCLWRPDEHEMEYAHQIIAPLKKGLTLLVTDRKHYESFNPSNGWGDYDGLVSFVMEYLKACEEYPEAKIRVSR